jgi:hypothetical protein
MGSCFFFFSLADLDCDPPILHFLL